MEYTFTVNGKTYKMDDIREMNDVDLYYFLYDVHLEGYMEGSADAEYEYGEQ